MWQETKEGLYKKFVFKDFAEAFDFMKLVAELAEKKQHHPRWQNEWNKVEIWLSTHEAGDSITKKDLGLAKDIDKLAGHPFGTVADVPREGVQHEFMKLYADGGSRGNPGPSASGYALLDAKDHIILQDGAFMGTTTNNQAEYNALKIGLERALSLGAQQVNVFMDSLLVINQMKGTFKVRHQDILPVHNAVQGLVRQFKNVTFTYVPRELNKIADGEVNRILDLETGTKKS